MRGFFVCFCWFAISLFCVLCLLGFVAGFGFGLLLVLVMLWLWLVNSVGMLFDFYLCL